MTYSTGLTESMSSEEIEVELDRLVSGSSLWPKPEYCNPRGDLRRVSRRSFTLASLYVIKASMANDKHPAQQR